jgi:hypothetical protein
VSLTRPYAKVLFKPAKINFALAINKDSVSTGSPGGYLRSVS